MGNGQLTTQIVLRIPLSTFGEIIDIYLVDERRERQLIIVINKIW